MFFLNLELQLTDNKQESQMTDTCKEIMRVNYRSVDFDLIEK